MSENYLETIDLCHKQGFNYRKYHSVHLDPGINPSVVFQNMHPQLGVSVK